MSATIHVVNPNSLEAVTRGIEEALRALRLADGKRIECHRAILDQMAFPPPAN